MPDLNQLGGRLELIAPAQLTAEQKPTYDYMDKTMITWANASGFIGKLEDGRMVGPFNTFLQSPELSKAFLEFQEQEGKLTSLDKRTRQVVILTVGQVWNCDYERYAHAAVAREAGLSEETINALRQGTEAPELSETEQIAREFVRSITAEHTVSDDLYAKTLKALGGKGIVDALMLAASYDLVSSLLNTFKVPVPSSTR